MKTRSLPAGLLLSSFMTVVMALSSVLFSAAAVAVELNDDVPETYIVKKGDTLWGISDMYLSEPWRWPELWDVNPQIDNPHLIFPGDELYLVWVDGQPRLRLRRGRNVRLSPSMRVDPLDLAIPIIPLDQIGPWLLRHRIMGAGEINNSAYVVAGDQESLISGPGDRVFGRGYFPDDERAYGIYRAGETYYDPLTNELLGYQAQDVGNARMLTSNKNDVVELEITRVAEEVRLADRLLPLEERILDATFHPKPPSVNLSNARMISVHGGVTQIGEMSIVVINKGQREGLAIGDVVAVYQAGEYIRDKVAQENVLLPDTRAGLALVFEVFEKASYAIILKASRPLKVMDKVKNP